MSNTKLHDNLYFNLYKKENGLEKVTAFKDCEIDLATVPYQKYSTNYVSKGWLGRKIIALPAMCWSGIVLSVLHLFRAILVSTIEQIKAAGRSQNNRPGPDVKRYANLFKHDLKEASGWLTTFFNDRAGLYIVQKEQFHKALYSPSIENSLKTIPNRQNYYNPIRSSIPTQIPSIPMPSTYQNTFAYNRVTPPFVAPKVELSGYQQEKEKALERVRSFGSNLAYLSDRMKDDEDVVAEAIKNSVFSVVQYASLRLRDTKNIALLSVSKNGESLKHLSNRMKDDEDVVITAIKNSYFSVIQDASNRMKNTKRVALIAVEYDMFALSKLSPEMRDDDEVVAKAVKKCSHSYWDASPRLREKYRNASHSRTNAYFNQQPNWMPNYTYASNNPFNQAPNFSPFFSSPSFNGQSTSTNPNFTSSNPPPFGQSTSTNWNDSSTRSNKQSTSTKTEDSSSQPAAPVKREPWSCPPELKDDTSDLATMIKRILNEAYEQQEVLANNSTNPNKEKIKPIIAKMLDLDPNSTDTEFKKGFYKASLKIHPDKCPDNPWAVEAFKLLSTTVCMLSD